MCGIAGYLSSATPAGADLVADMAARIAHRGPDGAESWVDEAAGVALAHRRLAVIDLSDAGRQPMVSADGRLILVFNGEIYNHRDLRAELLAAGWPEPWRGHSDTEVLLAALQVWGVAATLPRLNGMFAFALWDRERRVLTLARDRLGEKPLYYGRSGGSFLFGSELKALTAHPDWQGRIDRDVLGLYLRHGYVPDPHCIWEGMSKLPPGHWIEASPQGVTDPHPYWDLGRVVSADRRDIPDAELIDLLETRLKKAVALRMEADVPLGAFLSGGIDSSTVVALMQAQSTRPVKSFTIGFEVAGYNEAETAKAVARHLGTDHTELYLTADDALATVPDLPRIWDEPFADSSQIPTLLLSRLTREHVTVALSGDGGDEVFCGYNRYVQGHRIHQILRRLPAPARRATAALLQAAPAATIDRILNYLPPRLRYPALGDRLQKLGTLLSQSEGEAFYRALTSLVQEPQRLLKTTGEAETLLSRPQYWPALDDFRETMMYLDSATYLPGDILVKVDRASMATSLETRVPMLDHELIEFAWSLPFEAKLRDGTGKWALRQILERHVPRSLTDRPKMGFGIPLEQWLAGPLRDWAETFLASDRLARDGIFDVAAVQELWTEHQSGRRPRHRQLWSILMFQAWLAEVGAPSGTAGS